MVKYVTSYETVNGVEKWVTERHVDGGICTIVARGEWCRGDTSQDKLEYAVPPSNTPPVTAHTLSNTELAMAIDRASNSAGDASEVQKLWKAHLGALLGIQRNRATTLLLPLNDREEQGTWLNGNR